MVQSQITSSSISAGDILLQERPFAFSGETLKKDTKAFALFNFPLPCILLYSSINHFTMPTSKSNKALQDEESDEPVTPAGRLFLQPSTEQIINCVVGLQKPIEVESLKAAIIDSMMVKHPRFQSLLVKDKHGREQWRKLKHVDFDKHIFEPNISTDDNLKEGEEMINDYLADLSVSTPLKFDKPLWEVHILKKQKCCVLRLHHALGDGVSLMSLFLTCCRKVGDPDEFPDIPSGSKDDGGKDRRRSGVLEILWRLVVVFCLTLVYVVKFTGRCLWVKDEKTAITGGNGVELWPKKLACAKFKLDDMKLVKKSVPNGTINDVLFGVISSGLMRYFNLRSSKEPAEGLQMTGLAMVNLRKQPGLHELSKLMNNESSSRWGNMFGFILLPLYYHKNLDNPLESVTRAKAMLDKKKLSLEAYFSYRIGKLVMTIFGAKFAAALNYRILCNTTFTISNILGPQEEMMFAGNPITCVRVNSTSLPHAITMHMVSYNGSAYMQILVAKEIIPDPEVLTKCFQDALLEMKDAVIAMETREATISNGFTKDS